MFLKYFTNIKILRSFRLGYEYENEFLLSKQYCSQSPRSSLSLTSRSVGSGRRLAWHVMISYSYPNLKVRISWLLTVLIYLIITGGRVRKPGGRGLPHGSDGVVVVTIGGNISCLVSLRELESKITTVIVIRVVWAENNVTTASTTTL